jgi:TetR/AcrR family transcriptional repressor of nem operon
MRYSAKHKTETRERIVAAAAGLFRERGLDAVSVADVMSAAGLTHGGFYAHFGSKDELIGAALQSGRGVSAEKLRALGEKAPAGESLRAMVDAYMSPYHRARQAQGCVLATLAPEAGRHAPETRQVLAERAHDLANALVTAVPERPGRPAQEQALAIAACLVGGMILSRLEQDPAAGDRVLDLCRRFILDGIEETGGAVKGGAVKGGIGSAGT